MQGYDVGLAQEVAQLACLLCVAERQFRRRVVIDHLHSHRFGHRRNLRADIAVADDPKRLAAKFEAAFRLFEPNAVVRRRVLVRDLADQHHAQPNDQLRHRTRVRIRRIENRNTIFRRRRKIDLIDPNAKRPDCQQLIRRPDHILRYLRLRADADEMHALYGHDELGLAQRAANTLHMGISRRLKFTHRRVRDIFEQ